MRSPFDTSGRTDVGCVELSLIPCATQPVRPEVSKDEGVQLELVLATILEMRSPFDTSG
jgi:hypothetical protein